MYAGINGALSRQDDRYHTVPYRYGFLLSSDPTVGSRWAMFDHRPAPRSSSRWGAM